MKKVHLFILMIMLLGTATLSAQLFHSSDRCISCHNQLVTRSGLDYSFGSDWSTTMMANAARDPYWQAAIRRETLVHPQASSAIQNECSACHMPMTRYHSNQQKLSGEVFAHFPLTQSPQADTPMAADGVSCTLCHQIKPDGLGTKESFTAGFVVDNKKPMGQRPIYGPYEIDQGRTQLMRSASHFLPQQASHIQSAEFCASCHTLYTHALNEKGESIGTLPEQVPYLEWKHSAYYNTQSCQSCHMPEIPGENPITGVLAQARTNVRRHEFRGGNFIMNAILNTNRTKLGVKALPKDMDVARQETLEHLKTASARLTVSDLDRSEGKLSFKVSITNLTGHKLPTAYPSRRVWLHLKVLDTNGKIVFESGRMNPDGSIAGNDNDQDPLRYEPHHLRITQPDQVQIYEAIMADEKDRVTTVLLSALRYIKDNRILPTGFDKETADPDCAVYGEAQTDSDFSQFGDQVQYDLDIADATPQRIVVELCYQPIAYRWAHNLSDQESPEASRFIGYYQGMAEHSSTVLARFEREL